MTSTTRPVRPLAVLLSAVALVGLVGAIDWQFRTPHRTFEAFVAAMGRGDYAAAAGHLAPPSGLARQGDGSLVAVDRHGRSKTIAAGQLPFVVAEAPATAGDPTETLAMLALGPAKDGVLLSKAVQMRLTIGPGGLQIDGVD
jgi:hypothetical protein